MIDKYGLDNEDDNAQPENDNDDDDDDDDDGKKLKKLVQHCSSCAISIHLIYHSVGLSPSFTAIVVKEALVTQRSFTAMVKGEA